MKTENGIKEASMRLENGRMKGDPEDKDER
jgi:hypothetical protein